MPLTFSSKITFNLLWIALLVFSFVLTFKPTLDWTGFSFLIITIQTCLALAVYCSRQVSLALLYHVFILVFLNLIPWLHYSQGILIWRKMAFHSSTYVITNLILLTCNVAVMLAYRWAWKNSKVSAFFHTQRQVSTSFIWLIILPISAASLFVLLAINDFSIPQLLLRGIDGQTRTSTIESSGLAQLVTMGCRLAPFFCFLYAVTNEKKRNIFTGLSLFLILLLAVFPTGVARYMVGFVYIPLLLMAFRSLRSGWIFASILIFSICVVFPFFNQFRYFSGIANLTLAPDANFFYAAHFDAYENFASAIEANFITYGYQLLGVVFFFVPRAFWPSKPVGSGYEMAERLGYDFNNISMPFPAEGYVNFGFIGAIIFSIVLGLLMGKTDKAFSQRIKSSEKVDYDMAIYFFLLGAFFFLLRGDLLSSFAYLSAGLIVATSLKMAARTLQNVKLK